MLGSPFSFAKRRDDQFPKSMAFYQLDRIGYSTSMVHDRDSFISEEKVRLEARPVFRDYAIS